MATAKTKATEKPLVQIDDVVREMTDQEYEEYLIVQSQTVVTQTGE
jgi:hypothetical protein